MFCTGFDQRRCKLWLYIVGSIFVAIGIIMIALFPKIFASIIYPRLVLKEGTEAYDSWIKPPIPIFLEFHLFNWTNAHQIRDHDVKPHFVEMGPYVFVEEHSKENIVFHSNRTVSYFQRRTWFFDAQRSNGTLDDMVTSAHVISATIADVTRHESAFIRLGIDFFLNREGGRLAVTKPAGEWIFDGYQDKLLDMINKFNASRFRIPFKRFGWMVDRNDSLEYDGLLSLYTGVDDITKLGRIDHWNGRNSSDFYGAPCNTIRGSTGEVFPPDLSIRQHLTLFATDACRYLELSPMGPVRESGVDAFQWEGTTTTLDAGLYSPQQKCFCNASEDVCPMAGIVPCRKCRFGAPIYLSFPHFYMADPSYAAAVSGMNPQREKHAFSLTVQPLVGIPVRVDARLQVNMLMRPYPSLGLYRDVPEFFMPLFWFEQKAVLSGDLASKIKIVSELRQYTTYIFIALSVVGLVLIAVGLVLAIIEWRSAQSEENDAILTNYLSESLS